MKRSIFGCPTLRRLSHCHNDIFCISNIHFSRSSFLFTANMKLSIKKDGNRVGVFYRVLPLETMCWKNIKVLDDNRTVYVRCSQESTIKKTNTSPTYWTFQTDQVFTNHKQEDIYQQTCEDLLEQTIKGQNGIITAFGQTGTGKSSTIGGLNFSYKDRGIIPRIIEDLFDLKQRILTDKVKVAIQISYIEICRNHLKDLLKPYPGHISNFKDLTKIKIKKDIDAYEHLFLGEARKEFFKNTSYPSNCCSSVFTFHVNAKDLKFCNQSISESKLHIIDLAGADTVGNFSCQFKEPYDVGLGNLAKSQLEQFLLTINSNIQSKIRPKQRLNPLIQFLGDTLSTKSILRFIGHIRASQEDLPVTTSMLRFGQLLNSVKPSKYTVAYKETPLSKMFALEQALAKLKTEFTYNSILTNQNFKEPLSQERYCHVERTVNEYLSGQADKLALLNTTDVVVAIEIMKNICKRYENENKIITEQRLKASSVASNQTSESQKHRTSGSKASLTNRDKKASVGKMSVKSSKDKMSKKDSASSDKKMHSGSGTAMAKSASYSRKLTNSTASVDRMNKAKSKSELNLIPEIAPEFKDAWTSFLFDRSEEYANFLLIYEKNQAETKLVYNAYLKEIALLKQAMSHVEKRKHDLVLAKLTSEYQSKDNKSDDTSDIAVTCKNLLAIAEREQTELQEVVLKWQAELRAHLEICRNVKKNVQESFDAYCNEKFKMPVENLELEEEVMCYEKILEKPDNDVEEDEGEKVEPCALEVKFDCLKELMAEEKKKKESFLASKKEWVSW